MLRVRAALFVCQYFVSGEDGNSKKFCQIVLTLMYIENAMFSTRIPVLDLIAVERQSFRPCTLTDRGRESLAGLRLCAF